MESSVPVLFEEATLRDGRLCKPGRKTIRHYSLVQRRTRGFKNPSFY